MFGRKDQTAQRESVVEARMAQARANAVIAYVDAQAPEVEERIRILELRRMLGDNFGHALMQSMGRRRQ